MLPIPPRAWERAVGSRIALRARPLRLDRGVLHVVAANAAWSQELTLLGESITARLREEGLQVTSLRFQIGEVDAPSRVISREPPRELPPPAPLPADLRARLKAVEDEGLRAAIAAAASTNLAWERARNASPRSTEREPARPLEPPRSRRPRGD